MSLLDDLRNLLARHLAHVNSQTQQGTVRWIEDHLNRLDAVVSNDLAAGEAEVHKILGELYAATNAPAPAVPVAPVVSDPGPVATDPVSAAPSAPPMPEPVPGEPLPANGVPADPTA